MAPLASKVYLDWPLKKLTDAGAADTSRVFIVADLTAGGAEISRNLIYLAPIKEIHLKPAALKVETTGANGSYKIRVTSPVLARNVYLSFGNLDLRSQTITSICCRERRWRSRLRAKRHWRL